MNDTNALISRGLFPIIRAGTSPDLALEAESLTVTLTGPGVLERRSYVVKNRGPAKTVEAGTILGINVAAPDTSPEAVKVALDGVELPVRARLGLLLNRDGRVVVTSPDPAAIRNCIEHNDGGVCSQDWVMFAIPFEAGQTRRISLEFADQCGPRAAIALAIGRLHFYTEQFWAESKVGAVVARLNANALGVPARDFVPTGQYQRHSTSPTTIEVGELTWRLHGYRQKDYYGRGLVHPFAVDQEQILDRYLRGIGSSSADVAIGRILKADSILATSGDSAVPVASIEFDLLKPARVELAVWDSNGRVVRKLDSLGRQAGSHRVSWDGMDYLRHPVAKGPYRFRLEADGRWLGDREIRVLR
jgi:flagellar hook capping protein FlgD